MSSENDNPNSAAVNVLSSPTKSKAEISTTKSCPFAFVLSATNFVSYLTESLKLITCGGPSSSTGSTTFVNSAYTDLFTSQETVVSNLVCGMGYTTYSSDVSCTATINYSAN